MGDTRPAVALDAVLRRVPPRSLAACRCVCRKWRGIIDSRRLLRSDLLPFSVGGIFLSLRHARRPPALFARPSPAARRILVGRQLERRPEEVDRRFLTILDCRNGLLLFRNLVVNPATRQWARVPSSPAWPGGYWLGDAYLVFDPWVSPHHFKVMLIQDPSFFDGNLQVGSEWPPPSYTISVYSSSTEAWEERPFVRDGGDPAGTFGEARSAMEHATRHAVDWQGALYVHCQGDFIMRISLSDYKYRVIKLPAGVTSSVYCHRQLRLAKSKNGVYFAAAPPGLQLQVWFLDEDDSSNKTKWLLKYDINLQAVKAHFTGQSGDYPVDRPWILRLNGRCYDDGKGKGEVEQEWDFDGDDNVLDIEEGEGSIDEMRCDITGCVSVLGFHPFKEVAFLHLHDSGRIVACHLDSSKLQDLGELSLAHCGPGYHIDTTFVYTPCWIGELSEHN
jgi:hypothetical protein